MYQDSEQLEQYKTIWLTRDSYLLLKKERSRLKNKEDRKVSMAKILNNLVIQSYANETVRKMSK